MRQEDVALPIGTVIRERYTLLAILSMLAPVKDALSYLHRQKLPIVHRAIKPAVRP